MSAAVRRARASAEFVQADERVHHGIESQTRDGALLPGMDVPQLFAAWELQG